MGLPENYYHIQALQDIEAEENYYYQRELEEEYTTAQAERYEQVYELDLKKISEYNIWRLYVKQPTFFDAEFTKYFETLEEVVRVTVLNDYYLTVRLQEDIDQETSEDFLYNAYDNIRFAIDEDCRENLYTLPF